MPRTREEEPVLEVLFTQVVEEQCDVCEKILWVARAPKPDITICQGCAEEVLDRLEQADKLEEPEDD